jgi:hypothetical protein
MTATSSALAEVQPRLPDQGMRHPNMYLDATEIARIRLRIGTGTSPWKPAYERLLIDAAAALKQPA